MSLHAQLSPAARAALERQRRGARTTALIAGIAGIVLLSIALALFLMPGPHVMPRGVTVIPPDVRASVVSS